MIKIINMSYSINAIFMILIALQLQSIECNPIDNKKDLTRIQRSIHFLGPNSEELSDFQRSWKFPYFPSISYIFKDNDDIDDDDEDIPDTNERLDKLEKTQKEILTLLKKLGDDLLAIKDRTSQEQSNENKESCSTINEIKETTSFPSSEIKTTTRKSIEIESVPIITISTFNKTIAEEPTEVVFPSANNNMFVTTTPASETITFETIEENEIPSISLENQSQTTENDENITVNPKTKTNKISIDLIDQNNSISDINFPESSSFPIYV
ncbi:uncharacterized protein LOC124950777 [Vespa velutina]|uniref:uncharacterized protein LOC124950777 n=1 Tax=Vespa velutina TaxID=202808 RepID=UPI001FB1EB52|nr:uncharacterized protein LOC124950777 [Vespa velutina]